MSDNINFEIKNVSVGDHNGDLYAHYDVRCLDENGNAVIHMRGDWIDLDSGLLAVDDRNRGLDSGISGILNGEIYDAVNSHLLENPVSEDVLESYQLAAESRREAASYAVR